MQGYQAYSNLPVFDAPASFRIPVYRGFFQDQENTKAVLYTHCIPCAFVQDARYHHTAIL